MPDRSAPTRGRTDAVVSLVWIYPTVVKVETIIFMIWLRTPTFFSSVDFDSETRTWQWHNTAAATCISQILKNKINNIHARKEVPLPEDGLML